MAEDARQRTDNVKAQLLPQRHCAGIRNNHQIELHGGKAERLRFFLRMAAHGRRNAPAPRRLRSNIAAIADMVATASLIGFQIVGTKNATVIVLGHITPQRHFKPQPACICFRHVA